MNSQLKEPNRKIIVFSQFADTIDYLGEKLEKSGLPVFSYTAGKIFTKKQRNNKANFDAGYDSYKQQDEYKILVTADAISEGYNAQSRFNL